MRILLLLLIAIVAGSAAGSMYSWFLVSEPLPLATATANANDSTASSAASPTTVPAGSGVRSVASEMPVETDSRQGAAGQQGVLGQQAQKSDALRAEAEKAQPVGKCGGREISGGSSEHQLLQRFDEHRKGKSIAIAATVDTPLRV